MIPRTVLRFLRSPLVTVIYTLTHAVRLLLRLPDYAVLPAVVTTCVRLIHDHHGYVGFVYWVGPTVTRFCGCHCTFCGLPGCWFCVTTRFAIAATYLYLLHAVTVPFPATVLRLLRVCHRAFAYALHCRAVVPTPALPRGYCGSVPRLFLRLYVYTTYTARLRYTFTGLFTFTRLPGSPLPPAFFPYTVRSPHNVTVGSALRLYTTGYRLDSTHCRFGLPFCRAYTRAPLVTTAFLRFWITAAVTRLPFWLLVLLVHRTFCHATFYGYFVPLWITYVTRSVTHIHAHTHPACTVVTFTAHRGLFWVYYRSFTHTRRTRGSRTPTFTVTYTAFYTTRFYVTVLHCYIPAFTAPCGSCWIRLPLPFMHTFLLRYAHCVYGWFTHAFCRSAFTFTFLPLPPTLYLRFHLLVRIPIPTLPSHAPGFTFCLFSSTFPHGSATHTLRSRLPRFTRLPGLLRLVYTVRGYGCTLRARLRLLPIPRCRHTPLPVACVPYGLHAFYRTRSFAIPHRFCGYGSRHVRTSRYLYGYMRSVTRSGLGCYALHATAVTHTRTFAVICTFGFYARVWLVTRCRLRSAFDFTRLVAFTTPATRLPPTFWLVRARSPYPRVLALRVPVYDGCCAHACTTPRRSFAWLPHTAVALPHTFAGSFVVTALPLFCTAVTPFTTPNAAHGLRICYGSAVTVTLHMPFGILPVTTVGLRTRLCVTALHVLTLPVYVHVTFYPRHTTVVRYPRITFLPVGSPFGYSLVYVADFGLRLHTVRRYALRAVATALHFGWLPFTFPAVALPRHAVLYPLLFCCYRSTRFVYLPRLHVRLLRSWFTFIAVPVG